MKEIAKAYDHKQFEENIYKHWEESGYFKPEFGHPDFQYDRKVDGEPFTIMMPPPNVTGRLHLGHALGATLQDIMTRFHRLNGQPSLWLPGTDHAGIATQTVVDKMLQKKGINRYDLGREKFVEEVWKWKEEYGGIITNQLRRIGASCDWSRERFTLDEGLNKAVRYAFVEFYKKGLIYRGERVVNWCPKCRTAIADDEVDYKEQKGKLYYFKYDKNFPITIATTRPETKFGDTGVAVNPSDKRYQDFIGKTYTVDLDGVEREIKVFADRSIDMRFGTGAVGVTPAHSLTDWMMAEANNLPVVQVIDENGRMMDSAGKYEGMKAKEASEKLVKYLKENGLLEKEQEIENNLSICYRCGGAIEPLPSKQWFVKMKPLAEKATEAVRSGKIKIMPQRFEKVYFHWMDNIRDWCISRQLWWGHQIPVWYCEESKDAIASTSKQMGFAGEVVPQVIDGKISTWRLRDHGFIVGDNVLFENSATNEFFGLGKITEVKVTTVEEIDLKDKKHYKTYDSVEELISAFKKHNPKKKVELETPVWIYTYEFKPLCPMVVSMDEPKKCECCGSGLIQDPDVLDTWFSSGLWPFSTLGWPEKTKDLGYFYPTAVMETAYDILFFWVARMIMMGLVLTDEVPFKTVYLHGLVRDEQNRKMSKSLGNIIDPLDEIEKYGTDALRMALVVGGTPGQDVAMGESKIRGYRNFSNKIWNASRFVLLQTTGGDLKTGEIGESKIGNLEIDDQKLTSVDKELIARHAAIVTSVTDKLNILKFSAAGEELYEYFWHHFCDVYIEAAKVQLDNDETKENTKKILVKVLSESLILLHPFVPFVTEAVWSELKKVHSNLPESIMIAKWPTA